MGCDFPFTIMDVVSLLGLRIRRPQADGAYTDCPFCGDKRGKLKVTTGINAFRCNYCDEKGGMLALYGKARGISNAEALEEINNALQTGSQTPEYQVKEKTVKEPLPSVPQSPLAGIDVIHHTLTSLFNLLRLSEAHRNNLRGRGLTDEQIDRLGYKSTPMPHVCQSLTEQLIKQGCTVQGVPGFFINKYCKWTVKFFKRTAGIIVPIRGIDGLIRGAQIRLDEPIKDENDDPDKEGTKYIWLSSSAQYMGVTSGSPVHFVGDPHARTVYVTEGALKGDVAHCLMNRTFVCIAGANNVSQLDPIFAWLSKHGTKLIIEAHDMDKYANDKVDLGAYKIYDMARKYGMESRRLTWNPNHKGVDNWQLALKKKKEAVKEVKRMNFKERFIADECGFEALYSETEKWHNGSAQGKDLQEYLGFTNEEYGIMLKSSDAELEKFLLAQQNRQRFRIYQLDIPEGQIIKFAFQGIKAMREAGYEQPPASEYRLMYDGKFLCSSVLSDKEVLERIFERYNDNIPKDYFGRCIAPSDVVELYDKDKRQYFYRDSNGYVPVNFSPMLAKPMKS